MFNVYKNVHHRKYGSKKVAEKNVTKNVHIQCMFNVYKNQQSRQTGSRNLMGPKTLPTTKYKQNCDEKCAYMFNAVIRFLSST